MFFTECLEDAEVCESKNAKLKCRVEPADANVRWFHKGNEVNEGSKYIIDEDNDSGRRCLTITSCRDEDSGKVTAMVGEIESEATLDVKGTIEDKVFFSNYSVRLHIK